MFYHIMIYIMTETTTEKSLEKELDKPTTIEEIKKVQEPESKTKEPKVKETKTKVRESKKASVSKIVKLTNNGVEYNLFINERLPEAFLEVKLKESQKYIPIIVYRDIMRQVDEFGIPQFGELEKIITGKWKSGGDMITYKMRVTIERNKPGEKKPIMLCGSWYQAMSGSTLLSDAVHGNMKTLESRAMRDALKYSYLIFEYPEADLTSIPTGSVEEVSLSSLTKTADDVLKEVAETMPGRDIEKEIFDEYKKQHETLWVKTITDGTMITKADIIKIATGLKLQFGEAVKPLIAKIITADLNNAV